MTLELEQLFINDARILYRGEKISVAVEFLNIVTYIQEILISVLGMKNDYPD